LRSIQLVRVSKRKLHQRRRSNRIKKPTEMWAF
jgi:hypothetical protein